MNDKQLQDKLLQETELRFPKHDPVDQHPYDMNTRAFIALLPAPSNRTKCAAGAAACVAVLAGTAVAVHFLSVPGPGDVSSAPALPSETTYSAVSTAQGETSGTEIKTTEYTNSDSTNTTTIATSQGSESSDSPQPTEPVNVQRTRGKIIDMVANNVLGYMLFENGDLYKWNGTSNEKAADDNRTYFYPTLAQKNVRQYSHKYYLNMYIEDFRKFGTEYILYTSGDLYVQGYLPTLEGDIGSYGKEELLKYGQIHETSKLLMSGVQSLEGNLILTEKGEVYVYGISNNHVYKEPYKLLDNVSSINGRYIITKSNELLEMVDNQPVHIADNIKDAGYGDYQGYYITTQHDLYVFGDFKRCYFQTETPIKVASNVKNASVNEYGYAYLTHSNDLYLATPFMEKNVDGKEYPHHILEGGVLIAHDVKSYFYYNTLLYLDNRHTMHAFGYDDWLLMPYSMDEINGDMVLFDNITSFFGDSTTAVACASDGSMYIWGENNIGMLDPKNEGLFTSNIGKPLKITF